MVKRKKLLLYQIAESLDNYVLLCLIILVIFHLSGARGIFLPCRFSRGKIPDYELEEIIQLVPETFLFVIFIFYYKLFRP